MYIVYMILRGLNSYLSKFPWQALAPVSLMFVFGLVSALAPITVLWL